MEDEARDEEQKPEPKPRLEERKVVVEELEEMPDQTLRIGNTVEVPLGEAVALIEQRKAKHQDHPIGVVPEDWA